MRCQPDDYVKNSAEMEITMKIALINENSQAAKNAMVCETLKKVVEPMGHEVFNYGMYSAGEGAMLACNAFPKVLCGHVESPLDAYLFSQVNDGNCVALPFAENFGWGGELNLEYIFEKLFCTPGGGGYPKERVVPEQRNKKILDVVKEITHNDLCDILPKLDRELVKGALSGEKFSEYFFANCKCDKIAAVVKEILA